MSHSKEEFSVSMKAMDSGLKSPQEKFPKHSVPTTVIGGHGITYSVEGVDNENEGQAEYEVLKAILNRESYLTRLQKVARTIGRKFKPEVADVLDFVRAASLDVVDMILRWRELKGDHDAAFMWNGVNYLLKMPSDLDYLAEYLAIKRWVGFPLVRNPFCVPFPLEEGAAAYSENLTNPQHITKGKANTDGFIIGNLTRGGLKRKYLNSTTIKSSPYGSTAANPASTINQTVQNLAASSFVQNSDMSKVRQAELVILIEEKKFGVLGRDPDGRIMPRLQALTRQAHVELKKDDKRPLSEPSQTVLYAPHAASSEVGVAEPSWTPEGDGAPARDRAKASQVAAAKPSHFLEEVDGSVAPNRRGEGKVGGALSTIRPRGVESRGRRPLRTNLGSDIEFRRHRQIRTLGDKLAEIGRLREEIAAEKLRLVLAGSVVDSAPVANKTVLRPISRGNTFGMVAPSESQYQETIRGAVSNRHTQHNLTAKSHKELEVLRSGSAGEFQERPTSPSEMVQPSARRKTSFSAVEIRSTAVAATDSGGGVSSRSPAQNPVPARSPLRGIRKRANMEGSEGISDGANSLRRVSSPVTGVAPDDSSKGRSSPKVRVSGKSPVGTKRTTLVEGQVATIKEGGQLASELRRLDNAEIETRQALDHSVRDEQTIVRLKELEKAQKHRERSRDIERKRRLLDEAAGRRQGPPHEDLHNVYDYYAVRVQSTIRGYIARCWIHWYRSVSEKACRVLQATMRGWFGRMRVRRIRQHYLAARTIQRNFRGWSSRGTSAAMAKRKNLAKNAVVIQRVWRGVLGVRRCISKRALDVAAKAAFECVNAKSISVEDVKELARRILYAIEEPSATTFPPDEVLHLLRLTTMVLQSARGNLGLAGYDFFSARSYEEVGGEELTWLQAAKMVNRAERFIRLVRVMAYGPGAKPPRLVQVPNSANLLYAAQAQNPRWSLSTFETMGAGSKLCAQLFRWLTSIIEVAGRQQEFLSLIATSFPDWLPKLQDLQKAARSSEFEIELSKKCSSVLEVFRVRCSDDETLLSVLDKEMLLVKRTCNEARGHIKDVLGDIEKLKSDQSSREVFALQATEQKLADSNVELDEMAKAFQHTFRLVGQGDRAAIEALPEMKVNLTNQRLKVTELDGQRKLLEMQVEVNRNKRKDPARLTPEIIFKVLLAGEAKAAFVIAQVKARTMLRSSGVKHPEDLPLHLIEAYQELAAEEERTKAEARRLLVEAETERKQLDDAMARLLNENELKEQRSRDKMSPTEQELQEERDEDEAEARRERMKHKQFLPDSVLLVKPPRPRPVVIALSRDLPAFAKERIHAELTRLMPGLFVSLNFGPNMGIDFRAMQSVLDSGRSILMRVDHGLTRVTRDSFLQSLEITVKALVPSPMVAMAIGDEMNCRGECGQRGGTKRGVGQADLALLRDGSVKASLESMAWVARELIRPPMRAALQRRAGELVPCSKVFAFVLEAFFVVLSGDDAHKDPSEGMAAMSWRGTRRILVEPREMAAAVMRYRRGSATVRLVEVARRYLEHVLWPAPYGDARSEDPALNLLALYAEQWVTCERASAMGDGVPLQALTKSSMRGFQAVVVVTDEPDCALENDCVKQIGGGCGWRMAAAKLVRAALQDMRAVKCTSRIDGHLFTASVYREADSVYLEAYDPATSEVHLALVPVEDVPALMVPNGHNLQSGQATTPSSPKELYLALVRLLRFDQVCLDGPGSTKQRTLVCRRDYTFLRNVTRRVSGHMVRLKCYEAALGQLYFKAYLSDHSAHISLLVGDDVRLGVLRNTNEADGSDEHLFAGSEDARPLLPFLLDRLRLSPSRSMAAARCTTEGAVHSLHASFHSYSVAQRPAFSMRVRTHGGAGRILVRKATQFHGVSHVLEVRTAAHKQMLFISVYEPRGRVTLKTSLSAHMRSLLLPEVSDDHHRWMPELMRRLRLCWRGDRRLHIDRCVFRAGKRIRAQRMVLRLLALEDLYSVQLSLFDPASCDYYTCILSRDQALALIRHAPVPSGIGSSVNGAPDALADPGTQKILRNMRFDGDRLDSADSHAIASGSESTTAAAEDRLSSMTLRDILRDKAAVAQLADQLALLLEPVDATKLLFGYVIKRGPVQLSVTLDANSTSLDGIDRTQPLRTELRHATHLRLSPREGTTAGVVRARRQVPVVHMEAELDDLALRRSREADRQVLQDVHAAQAMDSHLLSLGPDHADNVICDAAADATASLSDAIHAATVDRLLERESPGHKQAMHEAEVAASALIVPPVEPVVELAPIVGKDWRHVFEAGVKTNFREGKVRWQGHVSVKISETMCWEGSDGAGKRYKFVVFEPKCAQSFEGEVRSKKHLIEVLGVHGQDLLDPERAKEMLLFVCRHRLEVVVNKKTWDGEDVPEGAPPYRIEFQSDRLYSSDKVTPVNVGGDLDDAANRDKLMDMESARGKKVVRLVRRVSGLIMQLTVFDLPEAIVAASELKRKQQEVTTRPESAAATQPRRRVSSVSAANWTANATISVSRDSVGAGQGTVEDEEVETALVEQRRHSINTVSSFAELREETEILQRYPLPAFRIVGYDPRSKRKVTLLVEPEAIVEVAGGVFSPYLAPDRKKELARVVCDSLVLLFPSGRPFEMLVPWSGAKKDITTATASGPNGRLSMRSSAERVVRRSGRLFRAAMRISRYDLLVSLYAQQGAEAGSAGSEEALESLNRRPLIFNFYSPAVSEAAEVVVSEAEQVDRVGRSIMAVPEGAMRAAAIRRLCQFFRCEIVEDVLDPKIRTMHVALLPPSKGFVTDYLQVGVPPPGESVRPVGIPAVFFPLDTCGRVVHRRGMALPCRDRKQGDRDFLVTVYTKSPAEGPERGLVVKVYDRGACTTSILHLGASEIMRLCIAADEPDLLRDMVAARVAAEDDALALDEIEAGFTAVTLKGQLEAATQHLVDRLLDIALGDLGYQLDAQDRVMPYLRSAPRGVPPS